MWLQLSEQRWLVDYSSREAVEGCFLMTQSHIYLGKNCQFLNLSSVESHGGFGAVVGLDLFDI